MPESDDTPLPADGSLPTILGGLNPEELLARGLHTVKMSSAGAHGWEPPALEEVARLFPSYELLGMLGRGGMGAVFKARQISLDRLVAIKLLPLEISVDQAFVDRFRREARAMAKLNHPHIITVYEFGQTAEGHLFFVMEFVDGANLADIIHGPGLAPDQALSIAAQVCTALAYAHGKGVVHRDIKPANVMIDTEGQVKVADFGLARLTDNTASDLGHTMTGTVMGTPDYMAPEQKRGMNVDHRADIYSLGVMLYEMLCRETPQGAFDLPSQRAGCDPRLDAIVLKAMQQAPDRRYQSTQEMKADVESARTPLPASPPPTAAPRPLPKPLPRAPASAKKSRPPLWIASAVTLAVMAGAAVIISQHRGKTAGTGTGKTAAAATSLAPALVQAASDAPGSPGARPRPVSGEDWQNALNNPVFQRQADVKLTAAGVEFTKPGRYMLEGKPIRDGALRLRAKFSPAMRHLNLILRDRAGSHYQVGISPNGAEATNIECKVDGTYLPLPGGWPTKLASPLQPGDPVEFEFRIVGKKLTASLNGKVVLERTDVSLPGAGAFGLRASQAIASEPVSVQAVEYLDLDPPGASASPTATTTSSAAATTDAPFTNSLGMKFVPVPITGGPTGGQRVLFSVWETRVQDYEVFATETKREWPKPPFPQGPTHPAVMVIWDDAQTFCVWLTERERKAGRIGANECYRLPSDHEWSCAVGIGDREDPAKPPVEKTGKMGGIFPWGTTWPPPPGAGNFNGEETIRHEVWNAQVPLEGYRDNFPVTSPAGSFAPNSYGIFDLSGNVWEWCEDWIDARNTNRTLRGGSWADHIRSFFSVPERLFLLPATVKMNNGFRVVLASASSTPPPAATPAAPEAFRPLFDGKTLTGWRALDRDAPAANWRVTDGSLTGTPRSCLMTQDEFGDFDLRLEWRVTSQGNGGIYYRVAEGGMTDRPMKSVEFQLVDDSLATKPEQLSGAAFDVQGASEKAARPAGDWNTARLLVQGTKVEHWINERLVCRYDLAEKATQESLERFHVGGDFFRKKKGRLALQSWGGDIFYRNLRISETVSVPAAGKITAGTAPAKPTASTAAPKQTLDLISFVDVERDKRNPGENPENRWEKRGEALAYISNGKPGEIVVPIQLQSQHYQIALDFSADFADLNATASRVHTYLPQRDGFHIPVRFYGDGTLGIGWIREQSVATLRWSAKPAKSGRIALKVDRRSPGIMRLEVLSDGVPTGSWQGDPAQVERPLFEHPQYRMQSFPALFSGGANAEFRNFRLTLFEGEAKVLQSQGGEVRTYAGHRYQFIPGSIGWTEAKAKAETMGGHLAVVTTKEEHDWVLENFRDRLTVNYSGMWLGGWTDGKGTPWSWVTGEPFRFTAWGATEPNGLKGGEQGEPPYYINLFRASLYPSGFGWNDSSLTDLFWRKQILGFLVEWESEAKAVVQPLSVTPASAAR